MQFRGMFLNSIGQYCLHNDLLYFVDFLPLLKQGEEVNYRLLCHCYTVLEIISFALTLFGRGDLVDNTLGGSDLVWVPMSYAPYQPPQPPIIIHETIHHHH